VIDSSRQHARSVHRKLALVAFSATVIVPISATSAARLLNRIRHWSSATATGAAAATGATVARRTAAATRAEVVAVREVCRHCRIPYAERVRVGGVARRQMADCRLLCVGRIARTRIGLTGCAHLRRIELRVQQRFVLWRHTGDFTAAGEKSENAAQTERTQDGFHDELLPSVETVASESRSHAEAGTMRLRVFTAFDSGRENSHHGW